MEMLDLKDILSVNELKMNSKNGVHLFICYNILF